MDKRKVRGVSNQVMELQQLVAGPLIATIEADLLSSQRYLDCLMEIAFESYDPATERTGKIRMLTFDYQSQDASGGRKQSMSIPMLALIPLPLLQVQEADFDFDIRILDALSGTAGERLSLEENKSASKPQSGGGFKLRASPVPKQGEDSSTSDVQQSLSANMEVRVEIRQADVPAGLSNLLHLTANNMQVKETETEGVTEEGRKWAM